MNDALKSKVLKTDFKELFDKLGYAFFTKGNYNLNIIGIRSKGNKVTNKFDDIILLQYNTPDGIVKKAFPATTDPGLYYEAHPMNNIGTAILVPGQYRGSWKIGKHQGKYEALVQTKPIKVYRDGNKDAIYDFNPKTITEGVYGVNIHKAGTNSTQVDKWSAGCQVFARESDFNTFMKACKEQVAAGFGTTFTYTLIKEEDL